jgi:hypothetical protein
MGEPAKLLASPASKSSHASSSGFQIAESMGFKGDFRQWEHLLRIEDPYRQTGSAAISPNRAEKSA